MRKTPLRPSPRPIARGERIKAVGEGKRKKMARYAAYLRSATWKQKRAECLERAEGRCEYALTIPAPVADWPDRLVVVRCPAIATTAHHVHYQRFGGDEVPDDLRALCKAHHDEIEATQYPYRRCARRASLTRKER